MRQPGARRHPWLLPVLFALTAAGIVYAFDVDAAHACAIIAAATVLGLCNEIVEGLETRRLEPEKLRPPETGLTDLQFLAYSLATGNRPIGSRAYVRFRMVALRRVESLGPAVGAAKGAGPRTGTAASDAGDAHIGAELHSVLADPQRGKRMTRQQLSRCLDELDALLDGQTAVSEGKQINR